jgi:hypothetical protein
MTSRYDNLINFSKLSHEQADLMKKRLEDGQAIIDAAIADLADKVKPEYKNLCEACRGEIDAAIVAYFRSIENSHWMFIVHCQNALEFAKKFQADSWVNVCCKYFAKKLGNEE